MSDFIPKSASPSSGGLKIGGLSRKAQKLQAMREKAAAQQNGGAEKSHAAGAGSAAKVKDSFANTKKTSFQRKAV
jgi:hypothetical protein